MWPFFRRNEQSGVEKQTTKTEDENVEQTLRRILLPYLELIEEYRFHVIDSSALPVNKQKMKALLKLLYNNTKNDEARELLETGFISIAFFQDVVGPIPINSLAFFGSNDMKADVKTYEKWKPWLDLSNAEMEVLRAEWKRFREGE